MRGEWTALPGAVTHGIADRIGGFHFIPASSGNHAEIAATVVGQARTVFIKAANSELGVRTLRFELLVSEAVHGLCSPAVEWHFTSAGWLVVAFEHLAGRPADLSPGSPDLDLLGPVVEKLGETSAPGGLLLTPAARLGFADPAMDAGLLVHTDLNPANLIVTPHGLRVVDWAMATRAAPWVELALLAQWLIGSGHRPGQAEKWLMRFPVWGGTDPGILDDFAARNASKWSAKAQVNPAAWVGDLADWTGRWWTHRAAPRDDGPA